MVGSAKREISTKVSSWHLSVSQCRKMQMQTQRHLSGATIVSHVVHELDSRIPRRLVGRTRQVLEETMMRVSLLGMYLHLRSVSRQAHQDVVSKATVSVTRFVSRVHVGLPYQNRWICQTLPRRNECVGRCYRLFPAKTKRSHHWKNDVSTRR